MKMLYSSATNITIDGQNDNSVITVMEAVIRVEPTTVFSSFNILVLEAQTMKVLLAM